MILVLFYKIMNNIFYDICSSTCNICSNLNTQLQFIIFLYRSIINEPTKGFRNYWRQFAEAI